MKRGGFRTFIFLLIGTSALELLGTFGFSYYEGLSRGEAAYATLLMILEHYDRYGFKTTGGRTIVITVIVGSLILIAYLIKWFAEYMIGISDNVKKLRMHAKVDRLKNHYIVCGLGRVGSQVARELHNEHITFVALDKDPEKVEEALSQGYLAFVADSTEEKALTQAGVERATGLIASLGDDSSNLYVTIAARAFNPDLFIVSRANKAENEQKMRRAGADRVAMPYRIGGYHMANMALRPNVVDYMDIMTNNNGTTDLGVEEMVVGEKSQLAGHRIGRALTDADISGATVIAINGADGTSRVRPSGSEVVYPGDRLIILGAKKDLNEASALIR
jgi:voltage-gated potassium channel